jgi:flagellar hook-associated protein 2
MAGYFGIDVSGSTDMSALTDAYRQTRQSDLDAIEVEKSEYETSLSFWGTIQSDINSVNSALDPFDIEGAAEDFRTRMTTSSDDSVIAVSATGEASIGTTIVQVEKLAEKDLLLSNRLNLEESFGETGTKVFSITVGEETFDISVEFTGEETNSEALTKIAEAINDTEDITINAAFVKDTPTTGILSLMADETGETNNIQISGSDMLSKLGLDDLTGEPRKTYSDGSAGFRYADASNLNAKFNVNGIEIVRNSNEVDDVLEGMTLTLKKAQSEGDQPIYLETDIDIEEVKELVQPVLTAYNKIVTDLSNNKTQRRATATLGSLFAQLRDIPATKITSVTDNEFEYLMAIGIEVNDNGTLEFADDEQLYDALKESPDKVAELFTSEDSFVAKLAEIIKNYHGENNLVSSMREQLNDRIDRTDDKYDRVQSQIEKEVSNLEQQYTAYLETYYQAQNQMNYLQTMPSANTSSDSSLLASYYGS